jgi:CRP/FNR family cyclic AMP-dependent transcriptional regulator
MDIPVQTLSQLPFFGGLGEDTLRRIAPHVHERTFSPGQVIVWEGEPCQAVYLIAQGLARTRRLSPEGREQVLAYLGPGGSFNLVSSLDGRPNLATVDAVSEVTLYSIACRQFHRILRQHQEVAVAVSEHLAGEVRRLSDMVESLALHTVRTRLARFLLSTAEDSNSPRRWTQEEIAAHIGTVREMVGRSLRAFADEGWIRRQRGRIVIVNRQGLEREASGMEQDRVRLPGS